MGLWYYVYDASSNLASQTDARGCVTSISYDLLNRPTGKSYSGSCGAGGSSVTYGYDEYNLSFAQYGRGQRTSMSDGSGSTSWRYDTRGRLRWESKTISGSGTFVTEWSYNSADLVDWMKYPGGNGGQQGEQVTFTYVPQMLIKTAYSQDYAYYYLQNASYDAAGRSDQLYLGAPNLGANPLLVNDSDYNAWNVQGGRLLALKSGLWGNRTSLQSLSYGYDAAGNVKTILDARNSNQKQCFTYDLIHRLTKATTYADVVQSCTTQVGVGNYSEDYTYNASTGNLASKTGMGTYTYGSASHVHAVTSTSSGWAFQYDLNGNATRRDPSGAEVYDLQYNAENRMVSVSGSATASFSFDGDGQRVRGTVASTTTAYLGNHLEYSNGVLTKYYYAGTTRLAMRQGSTFSWLVGDHLGSTSKVANGTTGAQTDMQLYRAWGENRWPTTSTLPTTMRYTGQRADSYINLYWYGSRWYDPALGRWIQPDTIIPLGQGVQAFDRYAYVNNSPVVYNDPSGHCAICMIVLGVALVADVAYMGANAMGWIPDYVGIARAEAVMGRNGGSIEVAAGLAVQGEYSGYVDSFVGDITPGSSGYGLAQTNADEISTLGLGDLNPNNPADAALVMEARIGAVQGACTGCSPTDLLIVAALAQNRSLDASGVAGLLKAGGGSIDWDTYFKDPATPGQIDAKIRQALTGKTYEKGFMLLKYIQDLRELYRKGWALPNGITEENLDALEALANGE